MSLSLINNVDQISHNDYLKSLSSDAEDILIASPFLFDNFDNFFEDFSINKASSIQLVTTLQPNSDDQLKKPLALLSFIENIKKHNSLITSKIHINNKLHGRLYIFQYPEESFKAVITSANLTFSGLNKNHEWGLLIEDQPLIQNLKKQLMSSIEYEDVPIEIINKLCMTVETILKEGKIISTNKDLDIDLINLLDRFMPKNNPHQELLLNEEVKVFLKPVGDKERPINLQDKQKFGKYCQLRFPNPRPKLIRPNDIVISFGTGSRAILSINTVRMSIEEMPKNLQAIDPDIKRWPWFATSDNHTPKFSDSWWEYNITIDSLKKDYLLKNPDSNITAKGSQSFGSFQRGAGFLAIDNGFAKYICERIRSLEKRITNF